MSLYLCDSDTLASLEVGNWKHNRPADDSRVREVARDIMNSGRVQGIIALASLSGNLVCYDGNHRRLALAKTGKNFKILLSVIWAATDDSIIDEYESLNKSVSVPLVYMPKNDGGDAKLIAKFCKELAEKYPKFAKPAKACHPPHFNRDVLADDISNLCEDYVGTLTVKQVIDTIKKMNIAYAEGRHKFKRDALSANVQSKCSSGGLWLFCKRRTIDRQYFELVREA